MKKMVVLHGAWSGGWAWRKMRPLMRRRGCELLTPTYTGLGERAHLRAPGIDLDTHINDVLGVLETEDLQDVIVLSHSYGGMVGTGVVDRARARVRQMIYLDAFVPESGQCLFDLTGPAVEARMRGNMSSVGSNWLVAPNPLPPDTSAEDIAWALPLRRPHPIQTFQQRLVLNSQDSWPPRAYIYCKWAAEGDVFRQFADRARRDENWTYAEMDASHNPHITQPQELCDLLLSLIETTARR